MRIWKRPLRLGLQARITALTAIILVAMFAVTGFIGLRNQAASMDVVLQQRVALAQTVAAHVDYHTGYMLDELAGAAAGPGFDLTDADLAPEQAALADLYRSGMFTYDVLITDARGIVLAVEPEALRASLVGADFSGHPHVRRALETGQPQVSGLISGVAVSGPLISLVVPLKNANGEITGLIGGALDPGSPVFSGFLGPMALSETGYAQVVDGQGMVIASTDPGRAGQPSDHHDLILALLQRGEPTVSPDSPVTEEGEEFHEVIAFAPIPRLGWGVTIEQERGEALAPVIQARNQIMVVAVIALAGATLFVWLTTRQVTKPVLALAGAARRIASGDLVTPVAIAGPDEVAELGHNFEAMRRRLAAWGEELEAAVQKRTRQLSVLYAIDRAAAQSLDLDEILNDALDKVLEVLEVEAGGIFLLEPDGETMTLRVHCGLSEEFVENIRRIRLGEGILGRAAAERKPVVLDMPDYPTERLAALIVREGFQTLASTPLLSAGELVGALNVGTRRPRAFPPEEIELLTAIGRQLGGAVSNARLHQETRQRAERLSLLNHIARALSATLKLDELLEVVHREITAVVPADAFFIALYDREAEELDFRIQIDKGALEPPVRRPLTSGLTASIITDKRLILIRDFEREKEHLPPAKLWGTRQAPASWLGVPMLRGENVVGVISVQAYRPNAYGDAEQQLLSTIADTVAMAIENARLYEAEQRRAARLGDILRLSIELAALRDERAILNTLVVRAAVLLESPACTVMLVDEAANEAVLAAQSGLPEDTPLGLRVPLTLPLIRRSLESGEPILLADIGRDAPEMRALLVRADIRAFFAYPMVREGRTIGFITLSSLTPRRPSAEEITACRLLAERAVTGLENAGLYTAGQQRAEELARLNQRLLALQEIGRAASSSLDPKEVLRAVRERIALVVPQAYPPLFTLVDEEAGLIRSFIVAPESPILATIKETTGLSLGNLSMPLSAVRDSPSWLKWIAGEAVVGYDLAAMLRAALPGAPLAEFQKAMGIESMVFAPLRTQARLHGLMLVFVQREVNDDDVTLLLALAAQAAVAVENARLYSETQQRAGELAALYEITHDLAAQHDLPALLQTVAERAATLLAAPGSSIYFCDAARGDLELVVTRGFPVPTGTRLQLGEGMAGRVAQTRQPLIVDHYRTWEHRSSQYAEMPFTAVVEVPMLYAGELIGVLSVHEIGATTHKFSEADARLLSLFAAQAAGAVHNARLYQQVRASEQEYRTLVENATELIWTLDTEGRFTFVNRQAEVASGQKAEDWIGKSFAPLVAPPEDLPCIQRVFLKTLAGAPQSYEVGVYRADGGIFRLSVNAAPLYRDEQVIGVISFGRDVTAQQEAEAALTQRMAELSSLFKVSSALRGVEGVEHMLPVIVDKAVESCRADCGNVLLLDESGEMLVCRYGTGARQRLVGARIRLGHGISGRVAQSGAPHLSPDFQHDPLLAFDPATSARLPEIASDVCVPLRVGEEIVGAMHVSTYASRTFTEAEIRLFTAIADMAASAIHRAGLFEQLEHRVHELSTLFDVGKMVTATLRIEDVLEFVVGAAAQTVHAEGCYLFLWDEREERLALRASHGFLAEDVGRMKYRLGEGLAGWVFLEGRVVNVPDLAVDPRWKRDPEHEAPLPSGRANNALVVPLVVGEKALGVLGVLNKTGGPAFTASDESLLTTLAGQVAIAIENARLYEDVRGLSVASIRSLATAIDARDPYTRGHSEGVTHLAVQLARELGWGGADLEMLEFAALLHDVGKIAVPDAILQKAKPLTPDEWNIIRLHPYHSAQIVKPIEPLQRIVPWVYHHQERWDGTGYPDGLKGEAIPLASRIIAVVDAFNAMTTDRPYRKALSVAEARAEIERGAGGQFDPTLAAAFLRVARKEQAE